MTSIDTRRDYDPILPSQEVLNAEALFSMHGHELVDPDTFEGEVVDIREVEAPELDPRVRVVEIDVRDPFIAADPVAYNMVRDHIQNVLEPMSQRYGQSNRTEAQSADEMNPFTRAWVAGEQNDALRIWRSFVPTARALGFLTNPVVGSEIVSDQGETAYASPETVAFWRFCDDGIGIRTRAVAMRAIAEGFLDAKVAEGDVDEVSWLSLASGTAEPSLKASKALMERTDIPVDLTVADLDGKALKLVQGNVSEIGFTGRVNTIRQNILAADMPEKLQEASGRKQYKVVENTGFEEYLPQEGDTMEAFKGAGLPQASEFTRNAYELVEPGGVLMSGNMVLNREQAEFVFNWVDWPIINARTEPEIINVYDQAGILDDPASTVTMYRVKGGPHVYNIVTVEKSPDAEAATNAAA